MNLKFKKKRKIAIFLKNERKLTINTLGDLKKAIRRFPIKQFAKQRHLLMIPLSLLQISKLFSCNTTFYVTRRSSVG